MHDMSAIHPDRETNRKAFAKTCASLIAMHGAGIGLTFWLFW